MKKLLYSLLLLIAVAFVSCDNDSTTTPEPPAPPVPEREGPYKEGLFMLMEGSSTTTGALMFLKYGIENLPVMAEVPDAYATVNTGHTIGTLPEDLYIVGETLYLLSQKGNTFGGDGQLVVADAYTLETKEIINNIDLGDPMNSPQHLVVVGDKAYIQYAVGELETHSGIRVYNLKTKTLSQSDISGTYGEFSKQGAIKGRMLVSRGKIYAACGENVVIIDPATDKVTKTLTYTGRQVKDIVKAFDNNLYMTISGTYTVDGFDVTSTSTSKIVGIDHSGNQLFEHELPAGLDLPVQTWSPNTAMCASTSEDAIFFGGNYDSDYYRVNDIYKFSYKTKALTKVDLGTTAKAVNGLMGYMCVDPVSNRLIVPIQGNTFALFDAADMRFIEYDRKNRTTVNFCSGVYSTKMFASSQINR